MSFARSSRIADLAAQVRLPHLAQERRERDPEHRDRDGLAGPVDRRARQPLHGREAPVGRALEARDPPVAARHHPGSGALEEVQRRDPGLDLRDELDRAGAGADHRDALAVELVVVIPGGGVEDRALELAQPGDVGQLRLVQRPRAGDQRAGEQRAGRGLQAPAPALVVPAGALDLAAEAHVLEQPLVGRDPAQVLADLRLGREGRAPIRVGREGERVDVARDVAATPRVGVLAPGPADLPGALQDDEVGAARPPQAGGHRQAGEAAADDRDLDFLLVVHAGCTSVT